MKPFDAKRLYGIAAELGLWQAIGLAGASVRRDRVQYLMQAAQEFCEECELRTALERVKGHRAKIEIEDDSLSPQLIGFFCQEINAIIQDSLATGIFMRMPERDRGFYIAEKPFGSLAHERFPSVTRDSAAAARCYALGEFTACVFHANRVLEAGIEALRRRLEIPKRGKQPAWKIVLDQVDARIKQLDGQPKKAAVEKRLRFLSGAAAHLRSFKNAWRNESTHELDAHYCQGRALDIFTAVRGFMRHVATELREPRRRNSGPT